MRSVLAYSTTEFHRARAQSALADGARARNRTLRVHGINATSVTAHKPPFPYSRNMLLISIRLSNTKFLPDQRVDQDGMIQLLDRSSTSTASLSTSTKNSQKSGKDARCRAPSPHHLACGSALGGSAKMSKLCPKGLQTQDTLRS